MNAKELNFLKFLISPKQLDIPIYQRAYSWKLKECQQLWNDIIKAGNSEEVTSHFVGSIVYVEKGLYQVASLPKLLVIDGQQRLTTLSLLLAALCKYMKKNQKDIVYDAEEINYKKIKNYYLLNAQEDGEEKYKLVLTRKDKDSYIKLLENLELNEEESGVLELDEQDSFNIRENYNFFKEKIEKTDINSLYKGISKLIIIDVSLDREKDNPQLIFESLNSTGLELTQSDLVRNYILMGLDKKEQEKLYVNYWYPMENIFSQIKKSKLFDWFIRDYLTVKLARIPTVTGIYAEFKKYSAKFDDKEELVKNIFQFAKYYSNIVLETEKDQSIKDAFVDINELKVDVAYPFILKVYEDYSNEELNKEEFIAILRLVESYVFRRAICGIPTASLNKTFSTLHKQIDKENYLESFQATMLLQDSYRRLPDDEEFVRELIVKDTYNFRSRNYLLRKIENHERKEKVNVESYTIEHIMPQNPNLNKEWQQDLGENWKEIQKKYLHTIGNLTLTGYNPEYQDKPFLVKRDLKDKNGYFIGFKDSPLRLNKGLGALDCWNETTIQNRAKELSAQAKKIWSFPQLNEETIEKYKKEEQETRKETYSIEDHDFLKEGEPTREVFDLLRKRILNIDSSVREEPKKLYIAYKSSTNFVDIVARKKGLSLRMNIPFDKIIDPQERCEDIKEKGKWGTGDTMFNFSEPEDIDYAINLIKQAFDNIEENDTQTNDI